MDKTIFLKYSDDRRDEFKIMTSIAERASGKKVIKSFIGKKAQKHILNMKKAEEYFNARNSDILYSACEIKNGSAVFEYIEGESYGKYISDILEKKGYRAFLEEIFNYREMLYKNSEICDFRYTEEFSEVFGNAVGLTGMPSFEVSNTDIIFDNIIKRDNKWYIIDYEWTFFFPVPIDFAVFRAVSCFITENYKYGLNERDILRFLGIENDRAEVFSEMEKCFQKYVAGDNISYDKFSGLVNSENMHIYDVMRERSNERVQVFFDRGNGYSEQDSYSVYCDGNNARFTVALKKDIKRLRIDPTERSCIVKINSFRIYNGSYYNVNPSVNGMKISDSFYAFMTDDPNIIFDIKEGAESFEADIDILPLEDSMKNGVTELVNLSELRFAEEEKRYSRLENDYNALIAENDRLISKAENTENIIAVMKNDISEFQSVISQKESETAVYREMYETIKNSTFWKMTAPLRKAVSLLRGDSQNGNAIQKGIEKIENQFKRYALVIDDSSFKDEIFYMKGWLADKKSSINNFKMTGFSDKGEFEIPCHYGSPRPDVGTALGNTIYNNSGFTAKAKISGCERFSVLIEYEHEGGTEKIKAGEIVSETPSSDGNIKIEHFSENIFLDAKEWVAENIADEISVDNRIYDYTVDVVIPIYNGYEFFERLFSSIKHTDMKYNLIIVNDKSPDERVKPYLEKYAEENGNVTILENEENLGFVGSVNRALEVCKNHIALVNSDVEVPDRWLERLMYPIIFKEKTATSTPFTTCGTICSFPVFCEDNSIFMGLSVNEIDSFFSRVKPSYIEMPTGVGFCMGMNKTAVDEIGLLDIETFGRGYGEENDWCQRALKKGWKNVMVENLFVWHKHGGSFMSEEKKRLVSDHLEKLNKKHPNYAGDVERYCLSDPARNIRRYITAVIASLYSEGETILAFDHNIGGGATAYLDNFRKNLSKESNMVTVRYNAETDIYHIECLFGEHSFIYDVKDMENLEIFISEISFDTIYLNEIVTYRKPYDFLSLMERVKKRTGARLVFLYHDFYSICPGVILMNDKGKFCGIPDYIGVCEKCVKNLETAIPTSNISMLRWRENWKRFIEKCDEVRVFSENSKELVVRAFGELENITVVPHKVDYMTDINKHFKTTDSLKIGFIGAVSKNKGLDIIKGMLAEIDKKNINADIVVMGYTAEDIKNPHFKQTGKYRPENLPDIVYENDIDVVFISSIWPETFSYTTDEVMKMGLPIACFKIGAPPERVSKYEKSLIIDEIDARKALYEIIDFSSKIKNKKSAFFGKKALIIADSESRKARALKNQFYSQGLRAEISSKYIDGFDTVVSFMSGGEIYYAQSTENIPSAKAYIVDTAEVERAVKKKYPHKKVYLNGIYADNETISLSLRAKAGINKIGENIYGVFSNVTEDIKTAVSGILESNENAVIMSNSVFDEDIMKKYSKRIRKCLYESRQENMSAVNAVIADSKEVFIESALCGTPVIMAKEKDFCGNFAIYPNIDIDADLPERAFDEVYKYCTAVRSENKIAVFCIKEV